MSGIVYTRREDELGGDLHRRIYLLIRKNLWARQSVGAAFGLSGGMLSIISGVLLWTTVRFLPAGVVVSVLNALEILFFLLWLPLLLLGVHCLDLLEKELHTFPLPDNFQPAYFNRWLLLRPTRPHNN